MGKQTRTVVTIDVVPETVIIKRRERTAELQRVRYHSNVDRARLLAVRGRTLRKLYEIETQLRQLGE